MSSNKATPEKVRSLLSSFLASSSKPSNSPDNSFESEDLISPSRKRKGTSLQAKDNDLGTSPNASPIKSQTSFSHLRSWESFVDRVDSFSPLTWFGKPTELSPLICARYGWMNVETDSLQCVSCKAHLYGKLPDPADTQAYKKFKEKLLSDILGAHNKFCVLAAKPCPESFCYISHDDPNSLLSAFTTRVKSLEHISNSLPAIDFSTLHSYNYDEGQGAAYCKRVILPDCDTSPQVVALSVTGWSCPPLKKDILTCIKCHRQVGLWNFEKESGHLPYSSEQGSETVEEPDAKMPKVEQKCSFNPVDEHKHWCPWVHKTMSSSSPPPTKSLSGPQTDTGTPSGKGKDDHSSVLLPTFILALKVMAPGLMDNNTGLAQTMKVSPMTDGLRCFRRVMQSWSSPKSASDSVTATPAAS